MKVSQAPGPVVPGSGALVTLNEQVRRVSMDNARRSRDYDEEPGGSRSSGALVPLNEQVRRVSMDNARKLRDYDEEPGGSRIFFLMSHGLSTAEAQHLLNKWGPNEVVGKAASKWWIFFRQVMPVNEERFSSQP